MAGHVMHDDSSCQDVRALVLADGDTVGVLLQAAAAGAHVDVGEGRPVVALEPIPLGHKIALHPVSARSVVRKYGEAIGIASADIRPGEHVHAHNLESARAERSAEAR